MTIDDYADQFGEEPGYLNFARVGPVGRTVLEEQRAQTDVLSHARFGSLDALDTGQDLRVREAVSGVTGFRPDQIVFQPNTSQGLMHAMFGITGGVALSAGDFPSVPYAADRAAESLGVLAPLWLETDHGRITPGNLRDQLTPAITAVVVSLVDFRTGYLTDIEGIRQVIGDRLLVVDAIQGFGVVDAPYQVADVVVSGGQKWVRSGWGTGFLALSDRAVDQLTPVFSGFTGTERDDAPVDEILPPARSAKAFSVSNPDPVAQARFAAALEEIAVVGVPAIRDRIIEKTTRIIDLADEFGIPVTSSRAESERAGIVVVTPAADQLTVLVASLFNHGITSTSRDGSIRLSAHVSTGEDTFDMLRGAFTSFGSAINV
ncbi:selenocysteine lyase/cysteine desulfurase [Conyzicola lurida]|uniref:Selenocysteine lyase/cysteine desulfurase n=1 Tax=Conyzicola lurida TaxID=1172621 RepID=A0A841AJ04_9MICO|nr:aminotransferase class V-fold PLP-dependent enzyme [Conyzicola lurida]MBB5842318.1 selenocysteine lyase/cysteine desulfurase [Conyzicola lurida]